MKLILITGLDGSGKSTMLARLEALPWQGRAAFLKVPHLDADLYQHKPLLHRTALFINAINRQADEQKTPALKALALFSSMLLFRTLQQALTTEFAQYIFCERHPLIDTGIYARFYAAKMDALPSLKQAQELNERHAQELGYLLQLAGVNEQEGRLQSLFDYMHRCFAKDRRFTLPLLREVFQVQLPDQVYYLKASAAVLMARLSHRQMLEAHESEAVFEKMIPLYDDALVQTGISTEVIDANAPGNLDAAFETLQRRYFSGAG